MVVLSNNVTLCTSLWRKGTGLMFTKKKDDFAYVFPFSHPQILTITMFFVFYPIDILFLKEGKVIEVVLSLKPFTNYIPKKKADTFIEFPTGTLKKSMMGKKVKWNFQIVEIAHK